MSKAIVDAEDAIAMFKETNSGVRLQSFDIASKRGLAVADQLLEDSEAGSDERDAEYRAKMRDGGAVPEASAVDDEGGEAPKDGDAAEEAPGEDAAEPAQA